MIPDRKPGGPRAGIFTWIVEQRGGKWFIIASQNTENKTPIERRRLGLAWPLARVSQA